MHALQSFQFCAQVNVGDASNCTRSRRHERVFWGIFQPFLLTGLRTSFAEIFRYGLVSYLWEKREKYNTFFSHFGHVSINGAKDAANGQDLLCVSKANQKGQ